MGKGCSSLQQLLNVGYEFRVRGDGFVLERFTDSHCRAEDPFQYAVNFTVIACSRLDDGNVS